MQQVTRKTSRRSRCIRAVQAVCIPLRCEDEQATPEKKLWIMAPDRLDRTGGEWLACGAQLPGIAGGGVHRPARTACWPGVAWHIGDRPCSQRGSKSSLPVG